MYTLTKADKKKDAKARALFRRYELKIAKKMVVKTKRRILWN